MSREQFWLMEARFEWLVPFRPTDTRVKPRVDDCRAISGMIHLVKLGCR